MLRRCRLSGGWSEAGPAVWDGGKELLTALILLSLICSLWRLCVPGCPGSLVNSLPTGERGEHRWALRTVRESCGIRSRASEVKPGRTGMERSGMGVSEECGTE